MTTYSRSKSLSKLCKEFMRKEQLVAVQWKNPSKREKGVLAWGHIGNYGSGKRFRPFLLTLGGKEYLIDYDMVEFIVPAETAPKEV